MAPSTHVELFEKYMTILYLSMDVCGLVLIVILLKSVVVTVCVAGCHMALLI